MIIEEAELSRNNNMEVVAIRKEIRFRFNDAESHLETICSRKFNNGCKVASIRAF